MTLLGVPGGFQLGTSSSTADPSGVNMSLDEMIESRRKVDAKPKAIPKKVSNADRSIATSRARRTATLNARRGISQSTKPTKMEIEKEVKKQVVRSSRQKQAAEKQKKKKNNPRGGGGAASAGGGGRRGGGGSAMNEKTVERRRRRENNQAAAAARKNPTAAAAEKVVVAPRTSGGIRRPNKKAVNAALNAMEDAGYSIPKGQQMVISIQPVNSATADSGKKASNNSKKSNTNATNTNSNKSGGRGSGGRGGGGGGRGRGRGRGRGGKK